ncbi:hypothetical protein [Microlunatus parietis]|uniref:AcrR family transcriptional regulator n=1 Tax=Microlunatus parietis TaxID=682979 RepID=A0A7Y9IBM3_9ACTN|nr:hypothetical protein [Microlunatus parietis]NYE73658.1 AcrR family transcriptional regulator [Microlunatus parietis]
MPRRSGAETQALLLETAKELLLERGVANGVAHIRLQEVVRRTGLTTGAAYRLWADQEDFHRDLAATVVRWRQDAPVDSTEEAVGALLEAESSLDEVIRIASARHVETFTAATAGRSRSSRLFLLALAVRATAQACDGLRDASRDRHAESVAEFMAFYQRVIDRFGYRLRRPYTLEQFAEAMAALGEGFGLHALEGLEHPDVIIGDDDEAAAGTWTLFGICVRGLVGEFLIMKDPAGPEPDAADSDPAGSAGDQDQDQEKTVFTRTTAQ